MAWIVAQVVGPVIALSVGGSSSGVLPKWTWWLGAAAVMINLVWPFAVTSPYLDSLCADIHLGRGDLDRAYQETIDGAT